MTKRCSTWQLFLKAFLLVVLCASVPQWFQTAQARSLPPQTEAKIKAILDSSKLREAHVGLSILDLGTVPNAQAFPAKAPVGKPFRVLFERDAQKKFMPASNMKLFTAAIALELLGKEKTFSTEVATYPPVPNFPHDSYVLIGGGDPSLDEKGVSELARQIAAKGIPRIERLQASSNKYGGESFDARYPFGWTLDDIVWYYGAPVRSLAYNRNQVDVTIVGGEKSGDPARCDVVPDYAANYIECRVATGTTDLAGDVESDLLHVEVSTLSETNPLFSIFGHVAPRQRITRGFAIPWPGGLAVGGLTRHLKALNIEARPAGNSFDQITRWSKRDSGVSRDNVVAEHNSPPLRVLFQRLLKNSDNLYAEMLLRNASYYHDGTGGDKAGPHAHALLKKWLIAQNIDTTALRFEDGSGLSRYNLLTPRATAELLAAINRMKDGDVIWNALPIAGTDGTLKNRMKSTLATGNVRAKTGTFSIASNLSGYVTTRDNRRLAVALYINFARDSQTARAVQEEVFTALAESGDRVKAH